jgi:hypothetical protein
VRKSFTSAGLAALLLAPAIVAVVAPNVRADTNQTNQVVLVAQNEELDVYDIDAHAFYDKPLVTQSDWVNGTPCFIPGDPDNRFVEADDNPDEKGFNGEEKPFFAVFKNDGTRDMSSSTYGTNGRIGGVGVEDPAHMSDPAGCVFDNDGNLFGIDVGENHTPTQGDGKVIEFFAATRYTTSCVVDPALSQPGMPAIDPATGDLLVPETGFGTIHRYSKTSATLPTLPTLPAPLRSDPTCGYVKSPFTTPATGIGTPSGIVRLPDDSAWAVSSVLVPSGVFKVSDQGVNLGPLAAPGPDTGTPFGLDFDKTGNLYYADLGVGVDPTKPGPPDSIDGHGGLRWVKAGATPTPRALATGWNFPDGVNVVDKSMLDLSGMSLVTCDWPTFGHDNSRQFAAPGVCSSIDAGNVSTLTPKWHFDTSSAVTAQPAIDVRDGTPIVYFGDSKGQFWAIDGTTGQKYKDWHDQPFKVSDPHAADYGKITGSAALATIDGTRVVVFGGAATLFVLDAANGNLLAAQCVDPAQAAIEGECQAPSSVMQPGDPDPITGESTDTPSTVEIESSPAIVPNGRNAQILFGMDYNEDPGVGPAGLISLELVHDNSGHWHLNPKWKYDPETMQTYTGGPSGPLGPQTEPAGGWQGCGNVWSSPMIDTAHQLAVFGVGNCGPKNLVEAIVGVNIGTGSQAFRFTSRADNGDDPDTDFGATPNMLLKGQVAEAGKDGHYYALDPTADPAHLLKWSAAVAMPSDLGGFIGSTAVGMSRGRPAVFGASAIPFSTRDPFGSFHAGAEQIQAGLESGTVRLPPGGLHAWRSSGDPDENNTDDTSIGGENLWDAATGPAYGAVVYAGNVVFVPDTFSFSMQAYDADTGRLLWAVPLNSAPASPPSILGDSIYFGAGIASASNDIGGIWAYALPAIG